MNPRLRTQQTFYISRPAPLQDALGGMQEAYAAPHAALPGHLVPDGGEVKKRTSGLLVKSAARLLLPAHADILPGDGIGLTDASVSFRVVRCDAYPLHLCAYLEAIRP